MYIPILLKIDPVVSEKKIVTDDHSQLIAKELSRWLFIVIPKIMVIKLRTHTFHPNEIGNKIKYFCIGWYQVEYVQLYISSICFSNPH